MNHRYIMYPKKLSPDLVAKYEKLADQIEATATEPIAIVWAHEHEYWTDNNGVDPERDCLLVTQYITDGDTSAYGLNISSHRIYR